MLRFVFVWIKFGSMTWRESDYQETRPRLFDVDDMAWEWLPGDQTTSLWCRWHEVRVTTRRPDHVSLMSMKWKERMATRPRLLRVCWSKIRSNTTYRVSVFPQRSVNEESTYKSSTRRITATYIPRTTSSDGYKYCSRCFADWVSVDVKHDVYFT